MKKYFYIPMIAATVLILILSGCAVNSYTGRITILNMSDTAVSNIKVGDTILTLYIAPGATFDYYYHFAKLSGKLTAVNASPKYYDSGSSSYLDATGTFNFYTNYDYDLAIKNYNGEVMISCAFSQFQGDIGSFY